MISLHFYPYCGCHDSLIKEVYTHCIITAPAQVRPGGREKLYWHQADTGLRGPPARQVQAAPVPVHCTQGIPHVTEWLLPPLEPPVCTTSYTGHGTHPGQEEIITPPVSVTGKMILSYNNLSVSNNQIYISNIWCQTFIMWRLNVL